MIILGQCAVCVCHGGIPLAIVKAKYFQLRGEITAWTLFKILCQGQSWNRVNHMLGRDNGCEQLWPTQCARGRRCKLCKWSFINLMYHLLCVNRALFGCLRPIGWLHDDILGTLLEQCLWFSRKKMKFLRITELYEITIISLSKNFTKIKKQTHYYYKKSNSLHKYEKVLLYTQKMTTKSELFMEVVQKIIYHPRYTTCL